MLTITFPPQMQCDFTPSGKRNWKIVTLQNMGRNVSRIRWYVSGRIFRTLALTGENLNLSSQWQEAQQ